MPKLIALTGYGRAGKDVLGAAFIAQGWHRLAMGDHIKLLFTPLVERHLGYTAFTEEPEEKEHIRPLLVHGGQVFYEHVSNAYFANVDAALNRGRSVINTRLFRPEEAERWRQRGGEIWEVTRAGNGPKEPEEAAALELLRAHGFIARTLHNDGTLAEWEAQCAQVVK